MSVDTTVAVLGTGTMGAPMARRLAAAGATVRAWNRTAARAMALAEHGVTVAADPAGAVRGADVVLTMLADDEALRKVSAAVLPALAAGQLWVQCSTVSPAATAAAAALARDAGVHFVDAPVLGTRDPAERGALVVLAAGPDEVRGRTEALLAPLARSVRWVGQEPGAATALKLVVNHWVICMVGLLAETLALAEATGVTGEDFLGAIEGGPTGAPLARIKGDAMLADEHPPSFPLRLARKDLGLVRDAAGAMGLPTPLLDGVAEHFDTAIARGWGDEDMAAVHRTSR